MNKKFFLNFQPIYFASILAVILFSLVGAYLEYNYILLEGLPYREVKLPTFAFLFTPDLIFFIPMLLMLAFFPTIYYQLNKYPLHGQTLRRNFALGIGSAMLGLILKDAGWFIFRAMAPLASDPLAYQWIRPSDYTASFVGAVNLGIIIPIWYIAFVPPILAIFISMSITSPELDPDKKSLSIS